MAGSAVVIGVGGLGLACARAVGAGRPVHLADRSPEQVAAAVTTLREEGFDVTGHEVDVTDPDALVRLAEAAAPIGTVVQTAGLSPVQASAEAVLAVDLMGAAYTIDVFAPYLGEGGSLTIIASMAGHLVPMTPEDERVLASTPTADLLATPVVTSVQDSAMAYVVAKHGVHVRVQAAAAAYGARGARINSVSPGIMDTPMSREELASDSGEAMRGMLEMSPVARIGEPEDIADAVAFLSSDAASFVTGTDLRVDGGVTAVIARLV